MSEIIKQEYIHLHCPAATKAEVLATASRWAAGSGDHRGCSFVSQRLMDREAEFSTGVGDGIAIPHCRLESIRQPSVFFAHLEQPIRWSSEEEVDLILVLAVPQSNAENTHIRLLSQLARKLVDEVFVSQLRELDQPAAVYALFNDIQL